MLTITRIGCSSLLLLVGFLVTAPSRAAAPPRSKPGSLTVDQRLRERFDPASVERRNQRSPDLGGLEGGRVGIIDGRYDPELFFPWELFDALISRAYARDPEARAVFRSQIEENLQAMEDSEPPADFWQRLEGAARPFIKARHEQLVLAERLPGASPVDAAELRRRIDALQESECRRRHLALNAAKQEFGSDALERILYLGVAPNTFIQEPVAAGRSEILVFVGGGCK